MTALLDAALELFAEHGYGATSIPDICARAGLTKGAFYSNYANKDALFLALLDRSWQRRAEWIRHVMPASEELARAVESGGRLPVFEVDRQWTLVSMEFSLHAIRQPDVAALLVEHETRVRSELAVLIAEALRRAGRVPTRPVIDLARMIVAVTEGNDIQALTDEAAGAAVPGELGQRAIAALLRHFSRAADPAAVSDDGAVPAPGSTRDGQA